MNLYSFPINDLLMASLAASFSSAASLDRQTHMASGPTLTEPQAVGGVAAEDRAHGPY
jgi:hypothetical protein